MARPSQAEIRYARSIGDPGKPGTRLWRRYLSVVGGELQYLRRNQPDVAQQATQDIQHPGRSVTRGTLSGASVASSGGGSLGSGRTRPGGDSSDSSGTDSVTSIFAAYQDELTAPRTAPQNEFVSLNSAGWKAPFTWWYQSFLGKWQAENAGGSSGGAPASTTPDTGGGGSLGDVTHADLASIGSKYGWSGRELDAWKAVIQRESGGRLNAQNPTSSAYGIAQGIDGPSWYAAHGGDARTVPGQLTAMANYITQRYGTPSGALAHENSYNWY